MISSREIGNTALPSDNYWGVPVLRLDLQCDRVDLPFARWGRERRKSRMRGTWHFYTDDSRFSRLWHRPTDLINSGCVSTVEPNWSVTPETTRAEALWQTFRKRTLARLWQDVGGVRILADLNVADRHADLNLLGIPAGWRSYCTRGSVARLDALEAELHAARTRAGTAEVLFVVYGGGRAVESWCLKHAAMWFPEEASEVRGRG